MGLAEKLDGLIGAVSPSWQRERVAERWRTRVIEHGMGILGGGAPLSERRYAGASVGDRNSTWTAGATSANTEIASSIGILRNRSRQLVRDEGWPNVAVRRIVSNAIGDGMRCTIKHPNETVRKRAQALWDAWATSTDCDADGRLDLYGLQALALRSVIEGGDCIARARSRRPGDGLRVPLQIQLLEGDYLDSSRDTISARAGRLVKQGIEFDALGRRTWYYLFRDHPGEFGWRSSLTSVAVPASQVAHAYRIERTGQVSGVPWGAPTFLAQRLLGNWKDATLYRLQAAACLVAIITGGDPLDSPSPIAPGNSTGHRPEVMNPGAILYPSDAQNVAFSSPPGVQGTDGFSYQVLLEVAAAYGVPYQVMTGDLTKVNYSSIRAGFLEFGRELRVWRRDVLQSPLLNPIFKWFLEAADLAGELRDDGLFSVAWTPSRREFIDAQKEIAGIVAQIRAGLTTWQEAAAELGWSPEELLAEYKAGLEMWDAAGISPDCDPRRSISGGTPLPDPDEEEGAEEADEAGEGGDEKKTGKKTGAA
jgi:lambda family phage portal protein